MGGNGAEDGHRRPLQATAAVAGVPIRAVGAHRRAVLVTVQVAHEGPGPLAARRVLDGQGPVAGSAPVRPVRGPGAVRAPGVLGRVPRAPLHAAVVGGACRGAARGLGAAGAGQVRRPLGGPLDLRRVAAVLPVPGPDPLRGATPAETTVRVRAPADRHALVPTAVGAAGGVGPAPRVAGVGVARRPPLRRECCRHPAVRL